MKISVFYKKLSKRALIGSMLFAVALWSYTSFNSEYKTYISIPFNVILPKDRAIEAQIPRFLDVEVSGSGWNIFNLIYFNNSKQIIVDLTSKKIEDSVYTISRNDLVKSVHSIEKVALTDIIPDNLLLKTGSIGSYKVPVFDRITVIPNENFTLVGKLLLIPDSIKISGNNKVVSKISKWFTQEAVYEGANLPFKSQVELSDTLSQVIDLSRKHVEFYADIQLTAEIIVPDVEIIVRGGSSPKNSKFYPSFVTVTLQGGIKELQRINRDKIAVSIDLNQILNDSTGVIIPKVEYPEGLKLLNVQPAFIYHFKESKIRNLAGY
jgi:hypothetical protein